MVTEYHLPARNRETNIQFEDGNNNIFKRSVWLYYIEDKMLINKENSLSIDFVNIVTYNYYIK